MSLDIRYEDAELIVLEKPAGLVVHPAPGNPDGTLVNALLAHCGDSLAGIGGGRPPGIVHRLDKNTSGPPGGAKTHPAPPPPFPGVAGGPTERPPNALVWGASAPPTPAIHRHNRP